MESRAALSRIGIGASVLTFACASAFAAFPQPPGNSPLALPELSRPGESVEPKVVVADPRHPEIRVELPASELQAAGEDMQGVYRKLVRTAASASATIAVAENGRVFFRRADNSALARAAEPALPEQRDLLSLTATREFVAEPVIQVALQAEEQLASPPASRRHAAAVAQPRRRLEPEPSPDADIADVGGAYEGFETAERLPDASDLYAALLSVQGGAEPSTPAQAPDGTSTVTVLSLAEGNGARRGPADPAPHAYAVIAMESRGVLMLSAAEAGDWLQS